MYFADAQVQGSDGGEDGVVIRCELDGTGVEIAAFKNLSDPRVRPILNTALVAGVCMCVCGCFET